MRWIQAAAIAALFSIAAEPCLAAEIPGESGAARTRVGGFAGVRLKLPMGGAERAGPSARLQLSTAANSYDPRSGALVRTAFASGVEIGARRDGRPALYMAGQRPAQLKQKLGLHGSTTYIVIGGVVLLVILVAAAFAGAQPTPGPHKGDF